MTDLDYVADQYLYHLFEVTEHETEQVTEPDDEPLWLPWED